MNHESLHIRDTTDSGEKAGGRARRAWWSRKEEDEEVNR
jgi:hypothetical protein